MTEISQSGRAAYPSWTDLLALVGVFVAATLAGAVLMMVLERTGSASHGFSMFLSYVVQFGITIAYALIQRARRGGGGALRFSLRRTNPAIVLWGVILTTAVSVVIEPLLDLFPSEYLEQLNTIIGSGGWAMLLAVVVAPVFEEVLFRGIVQESLTRKYGAFVGVISAAAVFGVVHIIPPQAVNAFFVGLVLGYIYLRTQSLVPVIVIHGVNNAVAYVTMLLSGGKSTTTRELIGNDTVFRIVYIVAIAVAVLGVVGIVVSIRRATREDRARREAEAAGSGRGGVPPCCDPSRDEASYFADSTFDPAPAGVPAPSDPSAGREVPPCCDADADDPALFAGTAFGPPSARPSGESSPEDATGHTNRES